MPIKMGSFPSVNPVPLPTVPQRPQFDGMALGKEFADTIRRNRAVSAEMEAARLFPDDPVQQAKEYLRITGEGGGFFAPTDAPGRYLGAVEARRKEQLEERKTKATERTADAAIISALKPSASSGDTAAIRTMRTRLGYAAEQLGLPPGSPEWKRFVERYIAVLHPAGTDLATLPVPLAPEDESSVALPPEEVGAGAPKEEPLVYPALTVRPLNDVYNDVQELYGQLAGLHNELEALPDGATTARKAVKERINNLEKLVTGSENRYKIREDQVKNLRNLAKSQHYLSLIDDEAGTAAVLPLITDVLDSATAGEQHNAAIVPQLSRYLVTLVGDDKIGAMELKYINKGGKSLIRRFSDALGKGFFGVSSIDTLKDIRNLILKVHTFKQDRVIEQWLKDKKQYGSDVEFSRAFERPVSDMVLLEYYQRNGTPEEQERATQVLRTIKESKTILDDDISYPPHRN